MSECFYCGKPISRKNKTRDHVLPISRNGSNSPRNIVDACKPCNNLKGCLDLEEFRLVISYRKGFTKKSTMLFPGEVKNRDEREDLLEGCERVPVRPRTVKPRARCRVEA